MRVALILLLALASGDWERVESSDCGFALDFPGPVTLTTEPTEQGGVHRFYSTARGRDNFSIGCTEWPAGVERPDDSEAWLDEFDERAAAADPGAEIRRVVVGGRPAQMTRSVYGSGEASLTVTHINLFTGSHLLSLGVADFDATDEEVERFFGSLEILDAK
ncbi:MAG: hypothetical protein AAFQ43_05080 [Bacteroidota bacterium]